MDNSKDTRKFGLIGKQLDHSFSKAFFQDKFEQENRQATYDNLAFKDENELKNWLLTTAKNYTGLNVTIPYKSIIIKYLDEVSLEAEKIGAVNTIHIKNGKLIGYNTDAYGFSNSIKPFLRNVHERALILGTGGASKAIAYILKNIGITVGFLSRNPQPEKMIFGYDQANQIMVDSFKLIVNCTPVGTFPKVEEAPDFPIELVGEDHLVIDLIYNPEETKFLRIAKEHGADTLNGLAMLKHQALKAWEIWNP